MFEFVAIRNKETNEFVSSLSLKLGEVFYSKEIFKSLHFNNAEEAIDFVEFYIGIGELVDFGGGFEIVNVKAEIEISECDYDLSLMGYNIELF